MSNKIPLYGELIDMLDEAENEADSPGCVSHLLLQKFKNRYEDITVDRPEHFYDTVCRIAAPTKPSMRGVAKLTGSPLTTYKQRKWVPKVRNKKGTNAVATVLDFLLKY